MKKIFLDMRRETGITKVRDVQDDINAFHSEKMITSAKDYLKQIETVKESLEEIRE